MLEILQLFYGNYFNILNFIIFFLILFLFYSRSGKAVMLSFDHKVNEASERERLLKAGVELNEGATRINGLFSIKFL